MYTNKNDRILSIFTRLLDGEVINKFCDAKFYQVNERTIIRDIKDIRSFFKKKLVEDGTLQEVIFDRKLDGYRLEKNYSNKLSQSQVLLISKILLESRAFTKKELTPLLDKLINSSLDYSSKKIVNDLIANEKMHYIEPQHGQIIGQIIWELGLSVMRCNYITINYERSDTVIVHRKLKPLSILFSEFYFYLVAYLDDNDKQLVDNTSPTIYRIDRIKQLNVHNEQFKVPYRNRFEEGEFRKRIQFMYSGPLQKVRFKFRGHSLEAVLDRLPTAKIIAKENNVYIIEAEVYGNGIDMWLRSQGEWVEKL